MSVAPSMTSLPALALVGFKNSGKTSLALEVARILADMGRRPGYLKMSHHPRAQDPQSDTGRLAQICPGVAFLAAEETGLFWSGRRPIAQVAPLMGCDCLIIEGGKGIGVAPRVILPRTAEETADLGPDLALGTYGAIHSQTLRTFEHPREVALALLERGCLLPGLDCGGCGRADCRSLMAEIATGRANSAECVVLTSGPVTVAVNGRELDLNPFTARIIAATARGLVSELKGAEPGEITITVRQEFGNGGQNA